MAERGSIRVGVGGWTYAPWRGTFYPKGLAHKDELAYAGEHLTALEINGTFYRSQSPATFAKWRDSVPDDFVFTVKAPRYATNRKVLAEAGESIERFSEGGVGELGDKLGPVLWQFATTKRFEPEDFAAFLSLLPDKAGGVPMRHAVELRHESFRAPAMVELARKHGVAIVWASASPHPEIADLTTDFAYVRLMGTEEGEPLGYSAERLATRASQLRALAAGTAPDGVETLAKAPKRGRRAVYAFVIGGFKARNPLAAKALIEALG